MGYRMRPRTQSKIKWGKNYFNHLYDKIEDFVSKECPSLHKNESDNTAEWEVLRKEWERMIKHIRKRYKENAIIIEDNDNPWTAKELADAFQEILDNTSDRSNFDFPDWLYLDWF